MNKEDYSACCQCVMDSEGNSGIILDNEGVCNFCHEYNEKSKIRLLKSPQREQALDRLINQIKLSGNKRKYDCIIGVSGGVDSTYVAYLVKQMGLRPLAVHFDNGWNSELAVDNIEKLLKKLDIDLFTYVVDWREFKSLQFAFLKGSTPDGEIPTDHGIYACLYQIAAKFKIRFIIGGNNFKTEGVMPNSWAYGHLDWRYIKGVNRRFGNLPLKTFPHASIFKFLRYTYLSRIQFVSILNYVDYDRIKAIKFLKENLEWRSYGGKHYESLYTKYFQGYILPEKFGIDKRKIHLSALILSGEITREQAMLELKSPPINAEMKSEAIEYLTKKFEISDQELREIMTSKIMSYADYKNTSWVLKLLKNGLMYLRRKGLIPN